MCFETLSCWLLVSLGSRLYLEYPFSTLKLTICEWVTARLTDVTIRQSWEGGSHSGSPEPGAGGIQALSLTSPVLLGPYSPSCLGFLTWLFWGLNEVTMHLPTRICHLRVFRYASRRSGCSWTFVNCWESR